MPVNEIDVLASRSPEAAADEQFIRRWSPRAMSGKALVLDELNQLFEAARWAPSCFNSQPWRFVYAISGTPAWSPLFGLLMDMNQAWAQHAGALIAVVAKKTFEHNDQPAPTHSFDTGSAWMSMALQAQQMGLVTHAMWGFHHDHAAQVLGLTDDFAVQAMVAVGYPGDIRELPEKYQDREQPSPRKSLAELTFEGRMP
ncbi:MAG: nitroreductase family protein [Pseudomonadota bacterium]